MPPKRSGKGDRNKQKQEEAERLAREEEERRLKEEEEKRQQEEQEQKEREEREKLEAEEKEFLELERKEFNDKRDNIVGIVDSYLAKKKEEYEWLHYTSCSTLPLVSDTRALNTFVSIFCEQSQATSLTESLNRLKDIYQLITETIEDEGHLKLSPKIKQLTNVVDAELDAITLSLMEQPNDSIDPETFNLVAEGGISGYLEYCLWGNVVKNPRLKNFTFKTRNFDLELPKAMLLADVTIRVMYLSLDFLSPLSASYHCPTIPPPTPHDVPVSFDPQQQQEDITDDNVSLSSHDNDGGRNSATKTPNSLKPPSSRASTAAKSSDERKVATPVIKDEESTKLDSEESTKLDSEENTKSEKDIDQTGGNEINGDNELHLEELQDDEVDLRCYSPSGGIIHFELYTLPPLPKTVQEWTLKQVVVDGLQRAPHPTDASGTVIPVSMSLSLPEHYYYNDTDSIQLAVWDEERLTWSTNKSLLQDVTFDLEERMVSFKLLRFAPTAIMTEKYVNFPYQSWDVLPVGINRNLIHLVGGCIEMTVCIERDQCTVIRPADNIALANIVNIPMSVEGLIQALSNVGFNFFPGPDVDKYASRTEKSEAVEMSVYESMAMSCSGWCFQWSKFNSECGSNGIVLSCAPCTSNQWKSMEEELPDFDGMTWTQVMCVINKSYQLNASHDEQFVNSVKKGEMSHSDLYTVLMKLQPSTGTVEIDPVHVHTMKRFLQATKPLSST